MIKKKQIRSLAHKKFRDRYGLFVAEGPRLVIDLITAGMKPRLLISTDAALIKETQNQWVTEVVDETELKRYSLQKTPQKIVALFEKPVFEKRPKSASQGLTLCLDGIQDPGNLGTIMRLADWFGLQKVVCSIDTADVFNPKVVQASMGAIARVEVIYTHLHPYCRAARQEQSIPVFGTFVDGDNLYTSRLPDRAIIVMGNEGSGIRPETEAEITHRLSIPTFRDPPAAGMESLNVGVATAIVCSEFFRQRMEDGR